MTARTIAGLWVPMMMVSACAGGSANTEALEEQVTQLKSLVEQSQTEIHERLQTVERSSADSLKSMEAILKSLSPDDEAQADEGSDGDSEVDAPAPAPMRALGAAAGCSPEGLLWEQVDSVLKLEREPVLTDGENFEVNRNWFCLQLMVMAVSGKAPKFVEARQGGVTLRAVGPRSLGGQLGFKNQDRVTAINGTAVATLADLSTALKGAGGTLKVLVTRRNEELTLSYGFQK